MRILQKTCLVCGKTFTKPINESINNWINRHKYCSKECVNKAPRSKKTRLKMRLNKVGKPSWNKGKKLTQSHKSKLRGKRGFIKDTSKMRGRRPWNKIGDGITPLNEKIRKSPEYKAWRSKVFKRDKWTCIYCKTKDKTIQADHIKSFAIIIKEYKITSLEEARECRELWDIKNGRTLCLKCHKKTDTYGINQHTYPQFKIK